MVRHALPFAALALALVARPAVAANPDALWHIVHDECVPHQEKDHSPEPCAEVNLGNGYAVMQNGTGYAVLKDIVGKTQYLLIPTAKIGGMESPEILSPDAPNYWQDAWQARRFVDARAGHELPRDVISLAINSIDGRTQNQLHIHVDCVRLDVRAALRDHANDIGDTWTRFPVELVGHNYMVRRLQQAEITGTNPFVLLADGIPEAHADMAHYTLVVVGANFAGKDGFVLLADHADLARGNRGSGEQLQDHACAAAEATGG
jgi:CDP-diacylglycerol pyrophosphatase